MGILPTGKVNADIFRCILNMDAYVVVPGGSNKVRTIQQWLNGRYYGKPSFLIGPADGIYSRDVQKSLMMAIQYELGISAPNGVLGPSTQANLKKKVLNKGSSGVFVQLFSAACVFNEPIPTYIFDKNLSSSDSRAKFTTNWDDALTSFVKGFQRFSQIPVTGKGDYQTWAQLLVSMGDADRPVEGCDTIYEIDDAKAIWLRNKGYKIIGRYLYNPPTPAGGIDLNKNIKPGELERIFKYGIKVVPIFQDNGRRLEDFTYSKGYQHAELAHSLADGFGFNSGTTIYFAVDYDATQDDINSNIVPYFKGIVAGLASKGGKYFHGVYGSRNVCSNVTRITYARYSYVSGMSWGFSGNLGFSLPANWSMNQIKEERNIPIENNFFDLDRVVWKKDGDLGQSNINQPKNSASDFVESIQRIYKLALEYANGDKIKANRLVCYYYRYPVYTDVKWASILGGVDNKFIDFVKSKNESLIYYVTDPVTGYPIGTQHIMASLQGHLDIEVSNNNFMLTNSADITGWGGDVLTFYKDWRKNLESYPSAYAFCVERLGNPNVDSSFPFADLIADADAFNMANMIKNKKFDNISDVITATYLKAPNRLRFKDFWNGRFRNDKNASDVIHDLMVGGINPKVILARKGLTLGAIDPADLSMDELKSFEMGVLQSIKIRIEG